MNDTIETIDLTPTSRLRVVADINAGCPRGDWHMLTGFMKIPHRGDSRRGDVPAVHSFSADIERAHEQLETPLNTRLANSAVERWARIFHGLHLEYDNEHGGYWFVALDGPDLFADNWPDLALGTPEHLAKQAEVIESEREAYRQWADGEAVGVILERLVTRVTQRAERTEGGYEIDLTSEPVVSDEWEQVESLWGNYLDNDYTAQHVALDNFELTDDEQEAINA